MEPNEAMKAMARRIAADAVAKSDSPDRARRMILSGEADDWHGVRSALAAIMETQRLDAELASLYIINGNSIHPDIPAESMAKEAKMIAHTTCQHISEAIRTGEHYALTGGGRG